MAYNEIEVALRENPEIGDEERYISDRYEPTVANRAFRNAYNFIRRYTFGKSTCCSLVSPLVTAVLTL